MSVDTGAQLPGFQSWPPMFLAGRPLAIPFPSLCLGLPISKMWERGENGRVLSIKHLEQALALLVKHSADFFLVL